MSHSKRRLQGAEEAFSLRVKLFQIDGLHHETVGAGLTDFLFIFGGAADGDDGSFVGGMALMRRQTSIPSTPGIMISRIKMSGLTRPTSIKAVMPSEAHATS